MNRKVRILGALFLAAAILLATYLSKGKPGAFWIDTTVFIIALAWLRRFPKPRWQKCRVHSAT